MKKKHSVIKVNDTKIVDGVVVSTGTINGKVATFTYDKSMHRFKATSVLISQ